MAMLQWRRIETPHDFGPRASHAITVVANKALYVIGGKDEKEYTNLVHVYDTETGQWRPTSTAPFPPRCHFASAFAGGKIWVIGGSDKKAVLGDVWAYDPSRAMWERQKFTGAQHLLQRAGMAAARSPQNRDHIILHGGYGPTPDNADNAHSNQLVLVDTKTLNIKLITPRGGNLPSARAYHSMVALDNSLVLYGGKDGNTLSPVPLALFDYRGKRWSYPETEGGGPGARSSHRAVAWHDAMLVFGGKDKGPDRLADLHTLRQTSSGWTWSRDLQPVIGARPTGRGSSGAAVVDNDLYVVAGYSRGGYLSDCWSLRLVDEAPECQHEYGGSERQEGAWRGTKRRRGGPLAEPQDGTPDGIEEDDGGAAENAPRPKRASGAVANATAAELRSAKAQNAQQVKELESENGRLHRQVATLQKEATEQRQSNATFEAQLKEKAAALAEAEGRVNQLKAADARQRLDLEGAQRSAHEVQQQRDALATEKAQAEEKLRRVLELRRTAEHEAFELEQRLRTLETETTSAAQSHERSMATLNQALGEAKEVRRREAAQHDAVQSQLAAARKAHNKELASRQEKLEAALADLLSERKGGEEELRKRANKIEELERALQVTNTRGEEALKGKADAEGSLHTLQHRHADMEARYEDMNKKTTAASNEVVRLTAERNALAHQLNQLKELDNEDLARHERGMKSAMESLQVSMRLFDEQRRRCT